MIVRSPLECRPVEISIVALDETPGWGTTVKSTAELMQCDQGLRASCASRGKEDNRNKDSKNLHSAFLASPKANKHPSRKKVEVFPVKEAHRL